MKLTRSTIDPHIKGEPVDLTLRSLSAGAWHLHRTLEYPGLTLAYRNGIAAYHELTPVQAVRALKAALTLPPLPVSDEEFTRAIAEHKVNECPELRLWLVEARSAILTTLTDEGC